MNKKGNIHWQFTKGKGGKGGVDFGSPPHLESFKALLDAYGWSHELGDEEILERLLEENLRRGG